MNTERRLRGTTAIVAAFWATLSMAQAPSIAVPKITGPIAVTAQSGEPFRGANEQPVPGPGLPLPVLQPYGYVEHEYFIEGSVDGKPYTTSLLVRKPERPGASFPASSL